MSSENKLDLNLLSVVVTLLDVASVTQAALKLGVSQPTVSAALGKLRTHFDLSLIHISEPTRPY